MFMLHALALRELMVEGSVDRLYWFDIEDMLPDGMTKRVQSIGSPFICLGNLGE